MTGYLETSSNNDAVNDSCEASVSNCMTYTGDNVCTACNNGYYLASATSCVDGIINC